MTTIPEPTVQPTHYVVSCLPEGHDERLTYTVQIEYRGQGLWAVRQRTKFLGAGSTWSWDFQWDGGPDEPATDAEWIDHDKQEAAWLAEHRFDFGTAMLMATVAARTLTYWGRSVADVLAEERT